MIDPELRRISEVELPNTDRESLREMRRLIGCQGLDWGHLDDMGDMFWVDEHGLARGKPIYAFKLRINSSPFAGRAIVTGCDLDTRESQAPYVDVEFLAREVEWLGLIVPEVTWIEEQNRQSAVVTYSRPKP